MKKGFYLLIIVFILAGIIISGCAKKATTKAEGEMAAKPTEEAKAPPPPEPKPAPVEEKKVLELKAAYFDFDKYNIRDDAKDALQNNVEFLKANGGANAVIEGYCDERGTIEYNMALGHKRAEAAKKYLVSLGVEASRISTISYGKEKPFCTEHNEDCWQSNRRAHFILK